MHVSLAIGWMEETCRSQINWKFGTNIKEDLPMDWVLDDPWVEWVLATLLVIACFIAIATTVVIANSIAIAQNVAIAKVIVITKLFAFFTVSWCNLCSPVTLVRSWNWIWEKGFTKTFLEVVQFPWNRTGIGHQPKWQNSCLLGYVSARNRKQLGRWQDC